MFMQRVIHDLAGYWLKLIGPTITLPCLQVAPCLPVSPLSSSNLSRIHFCCSHILSSCWFSPFYLWAG